MKIAQVAAQLYTIRDFLGTPSEIAESLKKVKAIGYPAVQLSGLGPIAEQELKRILDGEGLVCCATHEPGGAILGEPLSIVERLRNLGCRYTAYPHPGSLRLETVDDVKALAEMLNAAGKVLHEAGLVLAYHNHSVEFRRFDGRLMLEILYEETDPRYLQGEIDTYWVQHGGGDPVDWCRRLKNRLPLLHLKDYGMTAESQPTFREIGRGNLNWRGIVEAAEQAGCQWFLVEQDTCPGDPFESLKTSFDYIQQHLCSD